MPDDRRDDIPDEAERDLEERLRKLLGDQKEGDSELGNELSDELEAHTSGAFPDPEFPESMEDMLRKREQERLEQMDQAVRSAGQTRMPEPPNIELKRPNYQKKPNIDSTSYLGLGVGLSVAYTLIGTTGAGWLIGWLIDRNAGGYIAQAIGTLIGAIAGLLAGIMMIIRAQNKPPTE